MQRGPTPSTGKILLYCVLSLVVLLLLGVIGSNLGR